MVSARTYRSWKADEAAPRVVTDVLILNKLYDLQMLGQETLKLKPEALYGRRKMRDWLQRNGMGDISKYTVDRLMRVAGMKGRVRGRRTTTTIRSKDKIRAKDLLNRNFFTNAPNKV
ncbi:IS3 family transposase [Arthrobacter sp. Sr24]